MSMNAKSRVTRARRKTQNAGDALASSRLCNAARGALDAADTTATTVHHVLSSQTGRAGVGVFLIEVHPPVHPEDLARLHRLPHVLTMERLAGDDEVIHKSRA